MTELKLKKNGILTEEIEKRVLILESKNSQKSQEKTVLESATLKIGTQSKMGKVFEFFCKETTGLILQLTVATGNLTMSQIVVSLNGNTIKQFKLKTSIDEEILFIAEAGKNVLTVNCVFSLAGTKTTFKCDLSLTGYFDCDDTYNKIILLGQTYVAQIYGDTISFLNASDLESKIGLSASKSFATALLSDGKVALLRKEVDGTSNLYVYSNGSFSSYTMSSIDENYSSCAIRNVGSYYALYFLKGNFVYERYYTGQSTYSQAKLPIKAKSIRVFSCENHDYFCYVDLFGNFVVSEIEKDAPFNIIKNYTFRKIDNPQIYEIDSVCYLSYKCGKLVVERELNSQTELTVLGVGDEGFRLADGTTVIRIENQIELI